jgi:hypothetical protein
MKWEKKSFLMVIALLLLPVLAACGGDKMQARVTSYQVSQDGRTLQLMFDMGQTDTNAEARIIDETDDSVRVEARYARDDSSRAGIAVTETAEIRLSRPLGTRKVLNYEGAAIPAVPSPAN